MHRTRLAIIRKSYRPDGGAERIIERMLSQLQSRYPLEISLLTQEWASGHSPTMEIITLPKHGLTRSRRFTNFIKDSRAVLLHQDFDLVQSHERVPGSQIYRAGDGVHKEWIDIRCRQSSPLKRQALRASPFHRAVINAEQALFSHPQLEYVICNSLQVKEEILIHYPRISPSRIKVIYNGIELDEFLPASARQRQLAKTRLGFAADDPVLLSVGSGFYRKGVETTLRALATAPSWKLAIVGKEKQQKSYQRLCRKLGVGERVRFAGVQSDVRPYYAAADLLVHPALYDPFPNVVLEAMASGLGVVTSDKCGASEIISAGENGFVIPAGEHLRLAATLRQCGDPELLRKLGSNARLTAAEYPLERMSGSLVSLYTSLLDKQ